MIVRFDQRMLKPEVYDGLQDSIPYFLINYCINSDLRKAVKLQDWIKEQVDFALPEVIDFCSNIKDEDDYDLQMMNILRYVKDNITYIGDIQQWKMNEYWARAFETIESGEGDCEDGAILIYVLARLKGVPANRLMICAGSVEGGGHCWLEYKANTLPFDLIPMDWCYWYDSNDINKRKIHNIYNQGIMEYDKLEQLVPSKYHTLWFWFNDSYSSDRVRNDFKRLL